MDRKIVECSHTAILRLQALAPGAATPSRINDAVERGDTGGLTRKELRTAAARHRKPPTNLKNPRRWDAVMI